MFVGAFVGDRLVGELGVVHCGTMARYQDVGTDAAFRRRGIASHCSEWRHAGRWTKGAGNG